MRKLIENRTDQAEFLIQLIRSMGVYIWINGKGRIQIDAMGTELSDEIESQLDVLYVHLAVLLKRERCRRRS